jgi:hypothetical protein
MRGRFINTGHGGLDPRGYELNYLDQTRWGLLWRKELWEFRLLPYTSLQYRSNVGDLWCPNRYFLTDFGSIPPPLRGLPGLSAARFLFPYLFHDSGYSDGGLWRSVDGGLTWVFRELTRAQVDALLLEMIQNDVHPGGFVLAHAVHGAVRVFGGLCNYAGGDPRTTLTWGPGRGRVRSVKSTKGR